MQGTEAARADKLMSVFHICKAFKFPAVHRVFHIFEYNQADRTALASICGAQGLSISRSLNITRFFSHSLTCFLFAPNISRCTGIFKRERKTPPPWYTIVSKS